MVLITTCWPLLFKSESRKCSFRAGVLLFLTVGFGVREKLVDFGRQLSVSAPQLLICSLRMCLPSHMLW